MIKMEDARNEMVETEMFLVHTRNSVHGMRNNSTQNLTNAALSTGV